MEEHGDCHKTGRALVRVDPAYFRPPEVDLLIGNPAKARGQPIPPSPVLAALAAEGAPHDG